MNNKFSVDEDGGWQQILNRPAVTFAKRPALFIDRDGVLIEERHYLKNPSEVKLLPYAAETIKQANTEKIIVVIVTNQGGIGRQLLNWNDFYAVQERLLDDLATEGAFINAVYACPHHPKGAQPYNIGDHSWRKPNPGMILKALDDLDIDPAKSAMIGDKASDLRAAKRAGLKTGVHVLTGHGMDDGERTGAKKLKSPDFNVLCHDDLKDVKLNF